MSKQNPILRVNKLIVDFPVFGGILQRQINSVHAKDLQVIGLDTATGVLNTGDDLIIKGKGELRIFNT